MTALLAAAALALLQLDAASVGPFLLSRPFVMGPLFGAVLGHAWRGAALGAAIEAVTLEDLPLGGALGISSPVAAGTAAWLACGPAALAPEAAFFAGLAAGWLHGFLERVQRRRRGAITRRLQRIVEGGGAPRLGLGVAGALAAQWAVTFALAFAAFRSGGLLASAWVSCPAALRAAAWAAFLVLPWLYAGRLTALLWSRA